MGADSFYSLLVTLPVLSHTNVPGVKAALRTRDALHSGPSQTSCYASLPLAGSDLYPFTIIKL